LNGRLGLGPDDRDGTPAPRMPLLRNDRALLAAFRDGRRAALETVYRYYVRSVDTYLRSLARGAGAPELSQASVIQDLLQDVFLRAFSGSARAAYDGQRDYAPYLKTIARNSFVDLLRKRRTELMLVTEDAPLALTPEQSVEGPDSDPRVLAVLEAYVRDLSPELREVYEKRFLLGLTQDSACQMLGLSRRSLRTQEDRLRRGLRKSLLLAGLLHDSDSFALGALQANRE
jgi:RNA polymerase sigma factor (sigma-70 family)